MLAITGAGLTIGCTGFKERVYTGVCKKQGVMPDSPGFADCLRYTEQQDREQAKRDTADILTGAAIVVGGAAAAQSFPASVAPEPSQPKPQTFNCRPGVTIGNEPPNYRCQSQ